MERPCEIPIPDYVRTVAILGGSFDPPTRAHTELPLAACNAIGAQWLLVIPAAVSPFKPQGAGATNAQRSAMCRIAFADRPCVSISTIELDRGGTSYTVDTLRGLRRRFPQIAFRLLIGADQAESFHRWREPDTIITLAEPAVMLRGDAAGAEALLQSMSPHWSADALTAWRARIVTIPTLDGSSTEARDLLALEQPDEARLNALLDPEVLTYIRTNGLYGAGVSS